MKCLGVHKPLAVDELPLSVKLKGCGLEVTRLQHHSKRFSKVTCLLIIKNYDQQKLAMVQSLYVLESALLLLGEKSAFSFNSHSHNSRGCHEPNGQSLLL